MPPSIPLSSSLEAETLRNIPAVRRPTAAPQISKQRRGAKSNNRTTSQRPLRRLRKSELSVNQKNSSKVGLEENSGSTDTESQQHQLSLYSSTPSPSMMGGGMGYPSMYGSPYYGAPMMMGGPFSGIYQILFGVQNVVFSITQAVQLLGTNQHALQQAFDSLTGMMDHAVAVFHELRALEAAERANESKEQQRRRRRLKTLRWALMMGATWLLYKVIRRLTTSRRRRRLGYEVHSNNGMASYSAPALNGLNYPMPSMGGHGYNYGGTSTVGNMFGMSQHGAFSSV